MDTPFLNMLFSHRAFSVLLGVAVLLSPCAQAEIKPLKRTDLNNFQPTPLISNYEADDEAYKEVFGKKSKKSGKNRRKNRPCKVNKTLDSVEWSRMLPSKNAKFYIYLQADSGNPACQKEMPNVVNEYDAMHKSGRVELLFISFDESMEKTEQFLNEHKAFFPTALKSAEGVEELSGLTLASGTPSVAIVKASGEVIASGDASIIQQWRDYTIDAKKSKSRSSCCASSRSGCSAVVGANGAIHVSASGKVKTTR